MSRKSAYEEALSKKMEEFPLPDEDASWQKMKHLLDEDDGRAYWSFKSFRVLGLLILLLCGWGVWVMNSPLEEKISGKSGNVNGDGGSKARRIQNTEGGRTNDNSIIADKAPKGDIAQLSRRVETRGTIAIAQPSRSAETPGAAAIAPLSRTAETPRAIATAQPSRSVETPAAADAAEISNDRMFSRNPLAKNSKNLTDKQTLAQGNITVSMKPRSAGLIINPYPNIISTPVKTTRSSNKEGISKQVLPALEKPAIGQEIDFVNETRQVIKNAIDTASVSSASAIPEDDYKKVLPGSIGVQKNKSTDSLTDKEQVIKLSQHSSRRYFVSAGVGIQQQIQVGGQQPIRYGYKATSLVSDYIPSGWINFGQMDKWFLQTGFVFSSPQLVKEFAFNRQTKADASGTVTNTLILKKTFYSQLPISFNYYVIPNWSIGGGVTVTWLRGAIAERETRIKNNSSQPPVVLRQIIPINSFTDSFLYRSHSFVTLQTDYQWRRVSMGVKYTKDLQSYIRYTMPDGSVAEDRNWGFQAVLRIRLWQKEF